MTPGKTGKVKKAPFTYTHIMPSIMTFNGPATTLNAKAEAIK
jgi:hypothetical protein